MLLSLDARQASICEPTWRRTLSPSLARFARSAMRSCEHTARVCVVLHLRYAGRCWTMLYRVAGSGGDIEVQ